MQGLMFAAAIWSIADVAAAQLGHDAPPGYEALIREAVDEYDLGHWTEAKVFFTRAHALYPNARTERGLGLSCYELRKYVQSIGYLEAARRDPVQPLTAAMQNDLVRLIAQARQFISRAYVVLEPAQARLDIDGVAAGQSDDGSWLLDPGEHELQVSAAGFLTLRRSVRAGGGSDLHVRMVLEPNAVAGAREPAKVIAASDRSTAAARGLPIANDTSLRAGDPAAAHDPPAAQSGNDMAPWLVVGASAAFVVAGGIFVGVAAHDKARVEHPRKPSDWPALESTYEQGRAFFPLGFALGAAGLAGVASGLAWRYWPHDAEAVQVSVTPLGAALRVGF
jgi:hypothetical protein